MSANDITRVLVAMSGGVDSAVAAALLAEQGHDLVGVTMHLWDASGEDMVGRCCSPEDRDDARRVCEHLGIPHFVFDEREAFAAQVVEPFIESYVGGETPSPCVHCNREVKLGRLEQLADELGASHIATGHYARIEREPGAVALSRGRDRGKDQSYFLYGLSAGLMSRMILPLGSLQKNETRAHGKRLGVPGWDKKDSQELCFVPDGDIGGFIDRRAPERARPEGRIVDERGETLGVHEGVHRFTVGQRRGLGLAGGERPRYVLRIVDDDVIVGDAEGLLAVDARAHDAVWAHDAPSDETFRAEVQIRYRHVAAPAEVRRRAGGFDVQFDTPQRAIAPGQAAVVYRGDRVLGGGILGRSGE